MPLYEYECSDCGHEFEVMQKASDPRKTKCPKCGGRLRKVISAPALQFKGQGWYITDYARKTGGKESKYKSPAEPSKKPEGKKDETPPASKKN